MKIVNVNTEDLLERLEANLVEHLKEYMDGTKARLVNMREHFCEQLRLLAAETEIEAHYNFPPVENHEQDYQMAIEMAKMSVDDVIELSQAEFQQYVMDEWHWQHDFKHTTRAYLSNV